MVRAGLLQQEGSNKAPVHVANLPPELEPLFMAIEEYEAVFPTVKVKKLKGLKSPI
ncbi:MULTISPECIES: hypothetical protein [Paenibacillus]|uniref:hypothetical protein n=1 Tax=Paenibacillus TaxID=44249 RepID=UPI000CC3AED9|nr:MULTISPECIES: hypothetical protein [Paenibacillus]MCP1422278.1 hypothetical protein [Paenibacillus xylanexedens]PJN58188.1 hypothetical protein PAEAM_37600 [Paenibacillus sp. GM1FR]